MDAWSPDPVVGKQMGLLNADADADAECG